MRVTDHVEIPEGELSESFVRASGPGGQNVNKVSTAVELRWAAGASAALGEAAKGRLRRLAGQRWTAGGEVVIRCEETRSQGRNREIARERLRELVRAALVAPKRRVATGPTRGSVERRLEGKRRRAGVKAGRGAGALDP